MFHVCYMVSLCFYKAGWKCLKSVFSWVKPWQPLISYSNKTPIASKIFNYKKELQDFTTNAYASSHPACNCAASPFNYVPAGHVITDDFNIIRNAELKAALSKGPKYREPQTFTWRQNFKIIMDSVEDYVRLWAKLEKADENTLSEWIKAVRSLVKSQINKLQGTMSTKTKSVFSAPDVVSELLRLLDNHVVVPADKASNNIEGRGSWSLCLSCICLLAMHTLICVTFFFLLVLGVGCDFCLWLFLDFSVYLFFKQYIV